MRRVPAYLLLVLLAACASSGDISCYGAPPGMGPECAPSTASFHEREGQPTLRPGDCRPAPAMRVPLRGREPGSR